MATEIRPYAPRDRVALHSLLREPDLESEFGWLLANGELEDPLVHPFGDPAGVWVVDGREELDAFAAILRFAGARGDWSLLRVAVRGAARRRGLGRSLVTHATGHLQRAGVAAGAVLNLSHWVPNPPGEAFAHALGFEHERWIWNMERRERDRLDVAWPAGVVVRSFDSSDQAFQDWSDGYNRAFAGNAMSPTSTVGQARMLAAQPHFDPSGLILVYRGDSCVGFCRNAVYPDHGDVDVLGVVPEARGIGLGRALLRWGVNWLLDHAAPSLRLLVDGENERAPGLYRREGFEVVRSRRIWRRLL